jgi:hypothetical protein
MVESLSLEVRQAALRFSLLRGVHFPRATICAEQSRSRMRYTRVYVLRIGVS